jgi:hypothetical protein
MGSRSFGTFKDLNSSRSAFPDQKSSPGAARRQIRRSRKTGNQLAVIALAATGVLSAVWVALLHNLGTFIVIANAGRLLRIDEGIHLPAPLRGGNT